jgi:hypothetical protein
MDDVPIWRYLNLAKYIDLLRTRSLYFPKASRFRDETEGKWWGHAHLYQNVQHWGQSPANRDTLEQLLGRAGHDSRAISREINKALPSANQWVGNILRTALRAFPEKKTRVPRICYFHLEEALQRSQRCCKAMEVRLGCLS